jgi:uncharacterized protein (UPF0264 family)
VLQRVSAVAAAGVDYVKVGIARAPATPALLEALARCGSVVVPVLIADEGIDDALVAHALEARFAAVMLDTADKRGGSLLARLPEADLARFVARTRAAGAMAGLAGALGSEDLPRLHALDPDFAGFRGAVCTGSERTSALDARRLDALLARHAALVGARDERRVA